MSKIIENMLKGIQTPRLFILRTSMVRFLPDETCIKWRYTSKTGRKLDISEPKTFNEKLQWLKLHDHRPEYSRYVDKYAVREFIADTVGSEYLIPLIGVYDTVDSIPFESLPNAFVLKCTHDSGSVFICKDKTLMDLAATKKALQKALRKNLYWKTREWPYKQVKPRIICEKYMEDESGYELKDYKIFCFSGQPKFIQVDFNRFSNHTRNMYDLDWNLIPFTIKYPNDPNTVITKPLQLEKMIEIASKLSQGIPHLRVDLYSINDKIYFGEMTLYHGSGNEIFTPDSYDLLLGSWINLPKPTNGKGKHE